MNLRSGHGSTNAGADLRDNDRGEGIGNTNGEGHEAPLLAPPPPPPPPLMTHAEMMAEMLAARRESAHALEMLAHVIGGFTRGGPRWQRQKRGWCPLSRGALFLPGLSKDRPTHVHANR